MSPEGHWTPASSPDEEFWGLIGPIAEDVQPRWTPAQVQQWLTTDSGIATALVAVANAHRGDAPLLEYVDALIDYLDRVDDHVIARIIPMEDR